MRELSEETIEVGGKRYKLFLNRKGIVAYERDSKDLYELANKSVLNRDNLEEELTSKKHEKADNDDPFEGLDGVDEIITDYELSKKLLVSFYRIALYKYHPMTRTEATDWVNQAIKEYGLEQLAELCKQMVDDANTDDITNPDDLKKLKALRQTKK